MRQSPTGNCAPATPNDRNLHIYQQKLRRGESFSPREQYYYARELCDHGAYRAALPVLERFLEEGSGWAPDCIGACLLCAGCYRRLGHPDTARERLFRSFRYGIPQPEVCCEIGSIFLEKGQYQTAAFWYHLAMETGHQPHQGFRQQACCDYLPAIQLCVCYDRMGDISTAAAYNELAGSFRHGDKAVAYNRQYFAEKMGKTGG